MQEKECKHCEQYKKERDLILKRYQEEFRQRIAMFSKWEQSVLAKRLGIYGEELGTRKEVASRCKITEERVKEIEDKARKLLDE